MVEWIVDGSEILMAAMKVAMVGERDGRIEVKQLSPADADQVVDLERRSFIPSLQAQRETVLKRFKLGHRMIGACRNGHLIGLACYSYGTLNPADIRTLPKSEKELCLQNVPCEYDTVFLYNLELDPSHRGGSLWRRLVTTALIQARTDRCRHGVANVRVVSYAGGDPRYPQDRGTHKPDVREAIDAYLAGGPFPDETILEQDPLLGLYHRVPGCRFLWIVPNYAPDDLATGGIRIILYFDLPAGRSRL